MTKTELQIEEHRKMVAMTGNLSDFHLNNLKQWPYIVFDEKDLDKVDIDYNFTRYSDLMEGEELCAGVVIYSFIFKNEPPFTSEQLKKRLASLDRWVKSLFWTDTEVVFKKNGKKWEI